MSNTWSHGPHSQIPVLHSMFDSCGNRRQRLSGSTSDYRMVTMMFHIRRQTSSYAATVGQQEPHLKGTQSDTVTANRSNCGGADNRNDSFHLGLMIVGEGALYWPAFRLDRAFTNNFDAQNRFDDLLTAVGPLLRIDDVIFLHNRLSACTVAGHWKLALINSLAPSVRTDSNMFLANITVAANDVTMGSVSHRNVCKA